LRKKPLPERIQNAPDLLHGLELYFEAFLELNTCRPMGWGPAPIPSFYIDEFCRKHELDEEESEDMQYHIRLMDQAFLKHVARKKKD